MQIGTANTPATRGSVLFKSRDMVNSKHPQTRTSCGLERDPQSIGRKPIKLRTVGPSPVQ